MGLMGVAWAVLVAAALLLLILIIIFKRQTGRWVWGGTESEDRG